MANLWNKSRSEAATLAGIRVGSRAGAVASFPKKWSAGHGGPRGMHLHSSFACIWGEEQNKGLKRGQSYGSVDPGSRLDTVLLGLQLEWLWLMQYQPVKHDKTNGKAATGGMKDTTHGVLQLSII